ncbi:hypothetical protein BS17DRAFT_759942 [Gyrodon lividus]|nr:hypothetical protein BS17DRAFT_759942 [Gyrodon lividus]
MTPFVQSCDAGIIQCFKALHRRNFSRQAIDLDEAGEREIYKIDLLEAMVMANEAWNSVMPETIRNCWNHTLPCQLALIIPSTTPHADPLAWKIIYEFAMTDLSLPNAEIRLQAHLGNHFIDADWRPALRAVMDAEGDPQAAVLAIKPLEQAAMCRPGLKIHISLLPKDLPQLKSAGDELAQSINELKAQNCIFDTLPTLDEVLDPPEEVEICEVEIFMSGEKGEEEIIDTVQHKMAVARGEVIEIDSDEEDNLEPCITRAQAMVLCEQLAGAVLEYGEAEDLSELSKQLCRFRAHLR